MNNGDDEEILITVGDRLNEHNELATKRHGEREDARQKGYETFIDKGRDHVESGDRVEFRKKRLHENDGLGLERIMGTNDLLGVNYLEIGLKASRSVCRVHVRSINGSPQGHGTGFMVSPNLLMTNHHVLNNRTNSRRSLAEFNYEEDPNYIPEDTSTFELEPDRFFYANERLDFALVAVKPVATDGTSLSDFGYLNLLEESGKALYDEAVSIVQHPGGNSKQVAIRGNKIIDTIDTIDDFVHYSTDTRRGSSGSPVFNDQWDVVALHHAGVKKRNEEGKVLARDGSVWTPQMGHGEIAWIANEGIRVSKIIDHLKSLQSDELDVEEKVLLYEISSGDTSSISDSKDDMEVGELDLEWYEGSKGYEQDFLDNPVPLPNPSKALAKDIAPLLDDKGDILNYTHFSVVMKKSRRLALYTAVNIDGNLSKSLKRDADRWYFDPRMDKKYQTGKELYYKNPLDRGHLVRRIDPVWGDDAEEANEDTFHFTNCAPQHSKLNRKIWLQLERYILANARKHDLKVSVFTGPVYRVDDKVYRDEYKLPVEYWKVVVMDKEEGGLSATAYIQTQRNHIDNLEFAYGAYKTYQVPVTQVEELTELDFGNLRDCDPMADKESAGGRVIEGAQDIML